MPVAALAPEVRPGLHLRRLRRPVPCSVPAGPGDGAGAAAWGPAGGPGGTSRAREKIIRGLNMSPGTNSTAFPSSKASRMPGSPGEGPRPPQPGAGSPELAASPDAGPTAPARLQELPGREQVPAEGSVTVRTLHPGEGPFSAPEWRGVLPQRDLVEELGPLHTCAVVSSAGSLQNSGLGKEI
ncbi:unnamed protein product, partial [Caretta caretta]